MDSQLIFCSMDNHTPSSLWPDVPFSYNSSFPYPALKHSLMQTDQEILSKSNPQILTEVVNDKETSSKKAKICNLILFLKYY